MSDLTCLKEGEGRTRRPRPAVRAAALAVPAAVVLLLGGVPARAGLVIDPGIAVTNVANQYFDTSITSDPNFAAIEGTIITAINTYQGLFSNPVTVNIYFKKDTTISGGASNWGIATPGYQAFRTGLANQFAISGNPNQGIALANLPNQANNPVDNTPNLTITTADGRALGLNTPGNIDKNGNTGTGGTYDGVVSMNTTSTFPPQAQGPTTFSLLSLAEHEIDEVLGLGSGLDFTPATPWAEDLYRFGRNSNVRNFTTAGDNAWFSIDGGTTDLVQFNQAGGGSDYGDWHSSATPRVQDASGTANVSPTIFSNGGYEIVALNVIGYDVVPEPSTLWLAGQGSLLAAGFGWWRNRRGPARRSA